MIPGDNINVLLAKCIADDTHEECCHVDNKCSEDEGDCDEDSDCESGLKCGSNNCPYGFPEEYGCCYDPRPHQCTANDTHQECCRGDNKCGVNEGDCDTDSDCESGLKCVPSCPKEFPEDYDCCNLPQTCTANDTNIDCCWRNGNKCGENEGDCDDHSDCENGLKCGEENCPEGFPEYFDCCFKPSKAGK